MKALVEAYRALSDIYLKGSWIGEAIKRYDALLSDKGAYRLVYAVVEREFLSEYRISRLTEKAPKMAVKLLLKMGMTLSDEFSMPDYAAVSAVVETAKKVGKAGVCGFLNAVLRRYVREGKDLYPSDPDQRLSVLSNRPLWLVKRYEKELGQEAEERLLAKPTVKTHVRPALSFGCDALRDILTQRNVAFEQTEYGFYIGEVGVLSDLLKEGRATVMSYGSLDVCANVPYTGGTILDLCAAPGGKSVFLAEKFGAEVVSCDVYEHRVELIRKYAQRMNVPTVKPTVWDGTVLKEEWKQSFPTVLLDAPCSGFGSLASNPDVVLNRTESDLAAIVRTQRTLIDRAAEYVAAGGALVYATCSDLPSEDEIVVKELLEKREDFSLEKQCYTDPEKGGGECYYFAVLRKK